MEQWAIFGMIGLSLVFTVLMWTQIIDPRLLLLPGLGWVLAGFGATDYTVTTACCQTTESLWAYAVFLWLVGMIVLVYWIGALTGKVGITDDNSV